MDNPLCEVCGLPCGGPVTGTPKVYHLACILELTKGLRMKNCSNCGEPIDQERLEVLPSTTTCVNCSKERLRHDADQVCAKASISARNGFAPQD